MKLVKKVAMAFNNHLYIDTVVHVFSSLFHVKSPGKVSAGGATSDALYCYGVWMRHLVLAHKKAGIAVPKVVAEFGPGMSIGCGLASLLSGAEKYYGFEVSAYTDLSSQVEIFDNLVTLFKNRTPIPNLDMFPLLMPELDSYEFPQDILTDEALTISLADERIKTIRKELCELDISKRSMINFIAPWEKVNLDVPKCDFIFSQAVLEHIDQIDNAYRIMNLILSDHGIMSHRIDFKCHSTSPYWNRHWGYSKLSWRLIRGDKLFLINRLPCSSHVNLLDKYGFEKIFLQPSFTKNKKSLKRSQLSKDFRFISDDDLQISGVYCLAYKR